MNVIEHIIAQVRELETSQKLEVIRAITSLVEEDTHDSIDELLINPEFRKRLVAERNAIRSGERKMISMEETEFWKRVKARNPDL